MNLKANISRTAQLTVIAGLLLSINPLAAQQTGKLQISSLNPSEEIVPFINVLIEGNGIRRELQTIGVGDEYQNGGLVELPAGIYRVSSRDGNYFNFRRAAFRILPGAVTKINVSPLIRVREQRLMGDGSDRYVFAPKPAYDVYDVPGADDAITMLVRYDKKRRGGEYIDYESRGRHVMVSYDTLAIYATRIRFDRTKFMLTAEGDVILEDGTRRIKANNVTVRFNKGAPEVATN
jgi:hypothetical protein